MKTRVAPMIAALALASCASLPPPVPVVSTLETTATDGTADRLGDPLIWSGGFPGEPGLVGDGFIASTAEAASLVIHDLQGAVVQRLAGRPLSGIDVASLPLEDTYAVVIGGVERASRRTRIALFRLDRGERQAPRRWGEIVTDLSDPRGFCMRQRRTVVHAVAIDRRGEARQFTIAEGPDGALAAREVRRFRVPSAGSGCAIDPNGGLIYFSHARGGFWRYPLEPAANTPPARLKAAAPRGIPRSLGVSFLTDRAQRYLASLDHDRAAFSIWRVAGDDLTWLGRFEVLNGPEGRPVRSLAGIDAYGGELGPFADGVVVVQDQADDGSPNLKYVDWSAVKRALNF